MKTFVVIVVAVTGRANHRSLILKHVYNVNFQTNTRVRSNVNTDFKRIIVVNEVGSAQSNLWIISSCFVRLNNCAKFINDSVTLQCK